MKSVLSFFTRSVRLSPPLTVRSPCSSYAVPDVACISSMLELRRPGRLRKSTEVWWRRSLFGVPATEPNRLDPASDPLWSTIIGIASRPRGESRGLEPPGGSGTLKLPPSLEESSWNSRIIAAGASPLPTLSPRRKARIPPRPGARNGALA